MYKTETNLATNIQKGAKNDGHTDVEDNPWSKSLFEDMILDEVSTYDINI